MICISRKTLRKNPFETYRDPITGKWIVIRPNEKKVVIQGA